MSGGRNCYPESDVLVNKYNIRDKEMLEKFEIQKVFAKLLGLDVKPTKQKMIRGYYFCIVTFVMI